MIDTFKNLTAKRVGGLILILVIIIAFGFGGFGGGFNIGNQNNIAKINNKNISTQDFMDYLNKSGLSQQVIKENIDKKIIEELLSSLISVTLLDIEIEDLKLIVSKDILVERIKKNKNFQNEKGEFQRNLYEKFLLTNNMTAPTYEIKLRNNVLQKELFTYISGGAKSPNFLVKKYYSEKNRELNVDYINLNKFYKKSNEFSIQEIKTFLNENSNELKRDYIDFSYAVITPKKLTGLDEFNQAFFDKIDEIENKISKNVDFKTIVKELNINPTLIKDYINLDSKETIENKIYNSKDDKIQIIEDKDSFVLYQIDKTINKLPNLNDDKFKKQVENLLYQKEKFEFNKKVLNQIETKKFNQTSFEKLSNKGVEKIKLESIKDVKKFETNSVQILYSLPVNSFTLVADDKNDIFIAKITNLKDKNISENSNEFNAITNEASAENRNELLKSYDYLLNDKYKVVINQKTLDRVKNYFR
jgi:peptidyl-prolyl cis-trans isomerase D